MLERAGLIRRGQRGREHFSALLSYPLRAAEVRSGLYRAFWEPRLDTLAALLREKRDVPDGNPG